MKRSIKVIVSLLLCLTMLGSLPLLGGLVGAVSVNGGEEEQKVYHVGDTYVLGSYPQSRVTDEETLDGLNSRIYNLDWQSYNYYSGSGQWKDGKMRASNYMKYADTYFGGKKYRAVTFTTYRPTYTGHQASNTALDKTYQDDNGYLPNAVYWFAFEPLEWIVLDPQEGLVISKTIIDTQPFNSFVEKYTTEYYGDVANKIFANNYYHSSLRAWLNRDFFNTAFNAEEKKEFEPTSQHIKQNKAFNTAFQQFDSEDTTIDNVFLLTYWDVQNSAYGYSSAASRQVTGTDYAKAQGLCIQPHAAGTPDYSLWRLRTAGSVSSSTCYVDEYGVILTNNDVDMCSGVRPAMNVRVCKHIAGDWIVVRNATSSNPGLKVKRCTLCGKTLVEEEIPPYTHIKIKIVGNPAPTARSINYGRRLSLTAQVENMRDGSRIVWYVDGKEMQNGAPNMASSNFITPVIKKNTVIKAVLIGADNKIIKDYWDAYEIIDTENLAVKDGIFYKIVYFLRVIFLLDPKIDSQP